jgi:uncharacterized protein (DUF486 family)
MTSAHAIAITVTLLVASNLFMTVAWYGHLKHLNTTSWYLAAVVSWGIALITLALFVPFAMLYMGEAPKWNYLWAALCLMGAVYFIFFA